MSKEEKTALKNDAVAFVQKVVTEVYGQRASKKTVSATAKRVVATMLPPKLANR
ncbi:MAG: hypothetical protein JWL61_5436 [Gemmatimonadetes bacterium]|nr:hypothetical protein [Gemmatimonadota bacterium]